MPADAERWTAAAADARIAAELEGVYASVAGEVEARGPACWASGRCCDFEATGHRLYVTGLEAAYALARFDERSHRDAQAPTDEVPERLLALPQLRSRRAASERGLTLDMLDEAVDRGGCPFQVGRLCGAREMRPLGCRAFFCDRSAEEWQRELSERALRDIRLIHDRHGVPYRYGEWRAMLREAMGARR